MKSYPIAKPHIAKREEQYVLEVLRSGVLSIGPKVKEFERLFAKFIGTKYACAVSSGTAGLHLALLAAGVGPGDEVITSPFSFIASANAILYVGAKPVFVDIDPETYNLDPKKVEKAITKKTKALLPVHIFGQSADMTSLMKIAKKHKLKVVEDACESLGALHRGRKAGTFGESGVFAFYPNKQITTGEGGMIVTDSKKIYDLCNSLRNQGRGDNMQWLDHTRLGYNYRLDELSSAVGVAQMEKITFLLSERQKIAGWYAKHLSSYMVITIPATASYNTHTWFVYVVLVPKKVKRDALIGRLAKAGVSTKPYLPSIHLTGFYKKMFGYGVGSFPIAEEVSARSLALPFYIGLTERDIKEITKRLITALP